MFFTEIIGAQTTYHTKQINNSVGKMQTSNLEAGSLYGSHTVVLLTKWTTLIESNTA